MWQDVVLSVGSFVMAAGLVPTVLSDKQKPTLSSCLTLGTILTIFTYVNISLNLWLAAIAVGVNATMWWILAYQRTKSSSKK